MSKLLILYVWCAFANALELTDFVPGFMIADPVESSDSSLPVKPFVSTKRGNKANGSWYCNRIHNDNNNVFCKNDSESDAAIRVVTHYNSTSTDKTKVVDITDQSGETNVNQAALLDRATKNELDKTRNNFGVPIQPSEKINMHVGKNQVDFNIKY